MAKTNVAPKASTREPSESAELTKPQKGEMTPEEWLIDLQMWVNEAKDLTWEDLRAAGVTGNDLLAAQEAAEELREKLAARVRRIDFEAAKRGGRELWAARERLVEVIARRGARTV
jgi:hypothetical protein